MGACRPSRPCAPLGLYNLHFFYVQCRRVRKADMADLPASTTTRRKTTLSFTRARGAPTARFHVHTRKRGDQPQPSDYGGSNMMRVFYRASLGARARTRGTGLAARRLSFTRTMATPSLCPTRPVIHQPRSLDGHCAPMIAWPRHHLERLGDVAGTGGVSKPGASPAGRSAVVSLPVVGGVSPTCAPRGTARPAGMGAARAPWPLAAVQGAAGASLRPGDEKAAHGRAMRPSTTTTCLCAGEHQRRQSSSPYSAGPVPPRYRRCRGGAGNSWSRGAPPRRRRAGQAWRCRAPRFPHQRLSHRLPLCQGIQSASGNGAARRRKAKWSCARLSFDPAMY